MQTSRFDAQTVIDAGHPPVASGKILVDWDGVIQRFGMIFDHESEPMPGVVATMQELKRAGYTLIVFTSRLSKAWHDSEGWDHETAVREQTEYMTEFCKRHDIPVDGFTAEKIPAVAYFDDKAWRAEGDYGLQRASSVFLFKESERVRS
jgi:hypothetical protein